MTPKKKIALDMDEVIADVYPKFEAIYEQEFGVRLQRADYWGKKIYQLEDAAYIRDFLHHKGFFADLSVMPGSQEVVQELLEHYDVFITTAAMEFRASLEDKFDWLKEHFAFLPWRNIVFCGDKSILRADYMIDDHASNLRKFVGKGILYTSTHNLDVHEFTRVNNWKEIRSFFQKELEKEGKNL